MSHSKGEKNTKICQFGSRDSWHSLFQERAQKFSFLVQHHLKVELKYFITLSCWSMKKDNENWPFSLGIILKQKLNIYIVIFCKHLSELHYTLQTSHLYYYEKQMTGFYMKCNTRLKWAMKVQIVNALLAMRTSNIKSWISHPFSFFLSPYQ